jgi:hypothetical protein
VKWTIVVVVFVLVAAACNTDPSIRPSGAPSSGDGTGAGSGSGKGAGQSGSGGGNSGVCDSKGGFCVSFADAGAPAPVTSVVITPKACTNLCKQQMVCSKGETTVSGVVYAPTPPRFGKPDPIYNAIVYVPNATPDPFSSGASCDKCAAPSGQPLTAALTGPDGKFQLRNVPVGDNIPLVVQIGRWRRQVKIPKVAPCVDTAIPAELSRLPRSRAEGDIPLTAIATGNADALECVLRKIGVDEKEFTLPNGTGRIHMYKANGSHLGDATPPATDLTGSLDALRRYDITLLECEGGAKAKPEADRQNLVNYANMGGRLFVTHYEYTYLNQTPPFTMVSDWKVDQARPTKNNAPLTGVVDQSFPKGMAFAQWLQIVGASPMPGQIEIAAPRHDMDAVIAPAQRWVYTEAPNTVQQFTFNMPLGTTDDVENRYCGRVLFSDFHVNDITNISVPFPGECNDMPMTPQEKVLEFLLFDLASCIQPDDKPPMLIP